MEECQHIIKDRYSLQIPLMPLAKAPNLEYTLQILAVYIFSILQQIPRPNSNGIKESEINISQPTFVLLSKPQSQESCYSL